MYCPFIYFKAFKKSLGCANETNPYPFVFPVLLSFTTLAMLKELYLALNTFDKTQSLVSFPKFPTNIRQSFSGHYYIVLSCQTSPATFLKLGVSTFQCLWFFSYFLIFFVFYIFFCSLSSSFFSQFSYGVYTFFSAIFQVNFDSNVIPFFCIIKLSFSLIFFILSYLLQPSIVNSFKLYRLQIK